MKLEPHYFWNMPVSFKGKEPWVTREKLTERQALTRHPQAWPMTSSLEMRWIEEDSPLAWARPGASLHDGVASFINSKPATMSVAARMRRLFAGSPSTQMPSTEEPSAPVPVHSV